MATTISHASFKRYMFGPSETNNPVLGAINSTYSAGQCVGALISGWFINKYGRRAGMKVSTIIAFIGAGITTGAVDSGMLIAGRTVTGIATGALLSIMPAYISEISRREQRALLVGIMGMSDAVGYMLANWIGFAGEFAKGQGQWRIPLATQLPGTALLYLLVMILPQSPRWLIQKDRGDEAYTVLRRLHQREGEDYVLGEMSQITAQVRMETEEAKQVYVMDLFSRRYIRRTATAAYMMCITQLAGAGVIQSYQSLFYAGLGFKGNTILLISGCYGLMGVIGQGFNLWFIADKWPRVRTMVSGSLVLAVMLSLLMALSKFYGKGQNIAGSSAGVAFIFLFSGLNALFFNSTTFVIAAEVLPTHLRGYGMGFALACKGATSLWLSQVTPIAFAAIQWKFYAVFIFTLVFAAFFCAFLLPETNQLTLEEIGAAFGDKKMTKDLNEVIQDVQQGDKGFAAHVEDVDQLTTGRATV
ncbi:MFS general substrate transporter [Stipitochalara longipes BDJ]|nr:MFS general substrate transporter [Stipitochalara longipes BDJ]